MPDRDEQFQWQDNEDIVFHGQPSTAVYLNPHGQVVIRQQQDGYRDDDTFVFFDREKVPELIKALSKLA